MVKLLITGGAGFIGSNFVRHISETHPEDQIVVLDALTYAGNLENIRDLIDAKKTEFVHGSITDRALLDALFEKEKFDFIVNFAAETHVDRSIHSPREFLDTNIMGTFELLEATKRHSVPRYHQISTDEVYGDLGDNTSNYFREDTPLDPNCPYAASKASADLLVNSYHETYGMQTTITRCTNNYGPYQYPEKLIPFFLFKALRDEPLPMYGDGKNIRDWLYVVDHCRAIDLVLRKGKIGEVYNIGGHNEKTNLEITEILLNALGKPKSLITFVKDRQAHDRRYAMDASKIERELGWKPAHTFEEWIPSTIEWYLSHRDWVESCAAKSESFRKTQYKG